MLKKWLDLVARALPHLLLVLALMFVVFAVIDSVNEAMNFLGSVQARVLTVVWSVLSVACAVLLIFYRRKD
ncbi:MAG: hypothetical protein IKD06_06740 [Clostridia bacterium]|nr:hypothetical protein [Clostridia bacterium]